MAAVSAGLGRDPLQVCLDVSPQVFERDVSDLPNQGKSIESSPVRATWSWFPLGVSCRWESPYEVISIRPGDPAAFLGGVLAGLLGLDAALFRPGSASLEPTGPELSSPT